MSWEISKEFAFDYGHRVWTQELNGEYADDLKCACRHMHGHSGRVHVYLSGDGLDKTGMITDFRNTEWLKRWLNEFVDHQFIIDIHDPMFKKIITEDLVLLDPIVIPGVSAIPGYKICPDFYKDMSGPEQEYYEGFTVVDFVPTSENLSRWLAEIVNVRMKPLGVWVTKVEWWETPKSCSTYNMDWVK